MILLIIIYAIILLLTAPKFTDSGFNETRIEVSKLQAKVEERMAGDHTTVVLPGSSYKYAVFDISGRNLGSTIPKYQEDIDVRLFSTMKEYTAPLIVDGTQVGTLVLDYDPGMSFGSIILKLAPLLILCSAIIFLLILHLRFIKTDIIRPVDELHDVVGKMLKGDLDVSVSYDYDGEMGEFCHDFETMRDELKDASERERIYKEKERLLFASLSHDLKTPLSSISGYAESIKYGVVKDKNDVDNYLDIILKKTHALTDSIEDILVHVQTQMHEMSINKEEIYSEPFFTKLLAGESEDALTMGLDLNIKGDIPNVLMQIDPMRMEQVIQNIIGNSIKYTKSGGEINVEVKKEKNALRFIIEDNGCGIHPEDVPLVFEPFFRGEKSRDPNISGSGLGLSIAKYIIEQHGGEIACESVLGEGTKIVFTVSLL